MKFTMHVKCWPCAAYSPIYYSLKMKMSASGEIRYVWVIWETYSRAHIYHLYAHVGRAYVTNSDCFSLRTYARYIRSVLCIHDVIIIHIYFTHILVLIRVLCIYSNMYIRRMITSQVIYISKTRICTCALLRATHRMKLLRIF